MIKASRQNVLQSSKKGRHFDLGSQQGSQCSSGPWKDGIYCTHPDLGTARDVVDVDYRVKSSNS